MAMTTRSIDLLLRGVRAEFAYVEDQASKQLASYQANVYLDAANKLGPLVEEISAVGRQKLEAISITGVNRLLPTEELQPFPETSYDPSFITEVEPFKFTRRVKVSQESTERRDSMYQKALSEVSKLQVAYMNTNTQHVFDRFNDAFAVVTEKHLFDYGDEVALIASNHPDKEGSTHSNTVTASDVTPTAIESMVLVLQNQVDDKGEPMPMGGGQKYIVIPPAKVRKTKETLESEWVVDTANNNVNVWRSAGWVMVTSPFLGSGQGGSNTAFFILDGMQSPLKNVIFKPVTTGTWYDDDTKAFIHDIEFNHKVGAFDYRGIVGNSGA